jgi:hypothetical protein
MAVPGALPQPPHPPQPAEDRLPDLRKPGIRRSIVTADHRITSHVASHCQSIRTSIHSHQACQNSVFAEARITEAFKMMAEPVSQCQQQSIVRHLRINQ